PPARTPTRPPPAATGLPRPRPPAPSSPASTSCCSPSARAAWAPSGWPTRPPPSSAASPSSSSAPTAPSHGPSCPASRPSAKPSNVLVESHDGRPVPKVIDFGLAKATSGLQLSEHTLFTAFGSVLGTPLYMAPEQAAFNAVDVDTRADVYALGVLLYELLTGT